MIVLTGLAASCQCKKSAFSADPAKNPQDPAPVSLDPETPNKYQVSLSDLEDSKVSKEYKKLFSERKADGVWNILALKQDADALSFNFNDLLPKPKVRRNSNATELANIIIQYLACERKDTVRNLQIINGVLVDVSDNLLVDVFGRPQVPSSKLTNWQKAVRAYYGDSNQCIDLSGHTYIYFRKEQEQENREGFSQNSEGF